MDHRIASRAGSAQPITAAEGASDRAAFAAVYSSLRRFAAVVGPTEVDADDIVQEALTRALQGGSLDRFDSLEAYLRRAIINIASNHRRELGRRRTAVAQLVVQTQSDRSADDPSDSAVLSSLSPRARAVVYLREVEDRTYAEIARLVGVTPAAARMIASRALRRLRVADEHRGDDR